MAGARLSYLILYVRDLERSRAFYEDGPGFRPVGSDATSVDYTAGDVILRLETAADAGVVMPDGKDRALDITFLVDDLEVTRDALAARGVELRRTLDYEVGKTVDFYDPDGHWFSLYEPSAVAMGWPSGEKLAAMRDAGRPAPDVLDGHDLAYLFMFVGDRRTAEAFYHGAMGLEAIEGGPCRRGVTHAPDGVVKYDAGGTLLTTHSVDGDHAEAHGVSTRGSGTAAIVFHTSDVRAEAATFSARGVEFAGGLEAWPVGTVARFDDPFGHRYALCEPTAELAASR
jgi:catechol 2,3-dioxygenase-like lactoylglutathione lyase family enzyme